MELLLQSGAEAAERAESLRARGFDVGTTAYEGGHALAISGSPELMETLLREVIAERGSRPPRVLTGTVRWWKDDKGYGRITGVEAMADHGRAGAANVRVID
ncbi:MAG: hypothetical protein ACXVRK_15275 [Gaiellaceae bacterium]